MSLLTTGVGYRTAVACLCGMAIGAMVLELLWIGVVYERFPILAERQSEESYQLVQDEDTEIQVETKPTFRGWLADWVEFTHMPIFYSMSC